MRLIPNKTLRRARLKKRRMSPKKRKRKKRRPMKRRRMRKRVRTRKKMVRRVRSISTKICLEMMTIKSLRAMIGSSTTIRIRLQSLINSNLEMTRKKSPSTTNIAI